jgi:hypothetical protein
MDTTAAALQANVTVATIRTWCRIGAVAAAKVGGRWVIEAASLAKRIALGVRKPAKKVAFTVDTMTAIGGKRWTKNGHDRVRTGDQPLQHRQHLLRLLAGRGHLQQPGVQAARLHRQGVVRRR